MTSADEPGDEAVVPAEGGAADDAGPVAADAVDEARVDTVESAGMVLSVDLDDAVDRGGTADAARVDTVESAGMVLSVELDDTAATPVEAVVPVATEPGEGAGSVDQGGQVDQAEERPPAAPGSAARGASIRRGLVAAAGLLLLAALGLVAIGALVTLNDDAGGATVTQAVVLEGRPARSAAPRERNLDPFADVVFLRIVHTDAVAMLEDPGRGAQVGSLNPNALVASDGEAERAGGFDWTHVHDALTGAWGWIPAGRARAV